MTTQLTAICGSLRQESLNRKLLNAMIEQAPDSVEIRVHGLQDIPVYNQDDEDATGIPAPVRRIKQCLAEADGLILATPEYNHGVPGPLKNALDWMTRPPQDIKRVFSGKAVALIGATPGPRGTILAQTAWLPIFRALGLRPCWSTPVYAASAANLFDTEGRLDDEKMADRLTRFVREFSEFARTGA